jgi:hypothetical protein
VGPLILSGPGAPFIDIANGFEFKCGFVVPEAMAYDKFGNLWVTNLRNDALLGRVDMVAKQVDCSTVVKIADSIGWVGGMAENGVDALGKVRFLVATTKADFQPAKLYGMDEDGKEIAYYGVIASTSVEALAWGPAPKEISVMAHPLNPAGSLKFSSQPVAGSNLLAEVCIPCGTQAQVSFAVVGASGTAMSPALELADWGMCGSHAAGAVLIGAPSMIRVATFPGPTPVCSNSVSFAIPADCSVIGVSAFVQGLLHQRFANGAIAYGLSEAAKLTIGT